MSLSDALDDSVSKLKGDIFMLESEDLRLEGEIEGVKRLIKFPRVES